MRLVLLAGFQACYRFLLSAPLIKRPKVPTGSFVVVPRKRTSRTLPGPLGQTFASIRANLDDRPLVD